MHAETPLFYLLQKKFAPNLKDIDLLLKNDILEVNQSMCSSLLSYSRISMIQVRHKKKTGVESFYHPSLPCCPDQMLAVMELSQHLVSLPKTVRPIIPQGA